MFSLSFREMWSGVSGYLTDELDQIVASAQTRWFAQHDAEGAHADVTATSIESGSVSAGRLLLGESPNITPAENVSGDLVIRVIEPAAPAAIVSLAPDTAADIYLWNLSTRGRSSGEIVILRAAYDYGLTHFGFVVRSNSSLTTPADAAKFFIPGDGTGTNYDAITLGVNESLVVRLESAPMTPTSNYSTLWRVLGKLSV